MSIAIGTFAPQSSDFYSRMIMPTPKTVAPAPTTTTTNVAPPRGVPVPTTANVDPVVYSPHIITETTVLTSGLNDAPPAGPAPTLDTGSTTTTTTTATGATTGSSSGSTGGSGSDFSRLIDMIGSSFAPQDVNGNLAPVSFAAESTGDPGAAASSGINPVVIVVLLLAVGGFWYYTKHKGK